VRLAPPSLRNRALGRSGVIHMAIRRRRFFVALVLACAGTKIGNAQINYFTQSITAGFAGEVKAGPNSGISYPFLDDAVGFRVGYLGRPRRWLALEAGFDQIARPIGSAVCCEYSTNVNTRQMRMTNCIWSHSARDTTGNCGVLVYVSRLAVAAHT
jgi:hypothetical protein